MNRWLNRLVTLVLTALVGWGGVVASALVAPVC